MPKIPGNRERDPTAQRPWEKPEPVESEANYQRRAKEAREWFAQKKHLQPMRGKKP